MTGRRKLLPEYLGKIRYLRIKIPDHACLFCLHIRRSAMTFDIYFSSQLEIDPQFTSNNQNEQSNISRHFYKNRLELYQYLLSKTEHENMSRKHSRIKILILTIFDKGAPKNFFS